MYGYFTSKKYSFRYPSCNIFKINTYMQTRLAYHPSLPHRSAYLKSSKNKDKFTKSSLLEHRKIFSILGNEQANKKEGK